MDGPEKKAPLAGTETDREEEQQQQISLLASPGKHTAIFENDADVGKEGEEESDDDEIMNLHMKLAASSPNKKPLLDEELDGKGLVFGALDGTVGFGSSGLCKLWKSLIR